MGVTRALAEGAMLGLRMGLLHSDGCPFAGGGGIIPRGIRSSPVGGGPGGGPGGYDFLLSMFCTM